jgi:signal transduction histidine kinase
MVEVGKVGIFAGARDSALTKALLDRAGVNAIVLPEATALFQAIVDPDFAALVLDEDAIGRTDPQRFFAALDAQPPWSDLPLIVVREVVRAPHSSRRRFWDGIHRASITFLERPLQRLTMAAAVRAALQARARQHEVRDLVLRLQDENRAKDQFIAMLGHELRNPLSVITSSAQMLSTNAARAPHYRDLIQRQAHHLGRIVDDLLDTSRMAHGKLLIERHAIDVSEMIERCVKELGPAAQRRSQTLVCSISAAPIYVDGDSVRLEQVLCNLVTNAVKYTPSGGKIAVSIECEAGQAVIRVCDNGVGIAPELLPHVFELFTQGDHSLARTEGGLGMGLALVKKIVELHGGTVAASSEGNGKGATFEIRLPSIPAPEVAHESPPLRTQVPAALRIVLVEDNADARMLMEEYLTIEGYTVASAEDGLAGAELIVKTEPDVAIVDIGLPKLDGYGVARFVRSHVAKAVRLLALTGYGQPQDKARAMEAGFDVHMVKPIEPAVLSRLLASMTPA